MTSVKTIQVYCGASSKLDQVYLNSGVGFGKCMVEKNLALVYGSGKSGVMGTIAKTVAEAGGKVTGIIPKFLADRYNLEPPYGYGETIVTQTMHERKAMMIEKADAFVALPGGLGTMEELTETITWYQLGLHKKPIGILNTNNFYGHFLEWLAHAEKEGFIHEVDIGDVIICESDPETLVEEILKKI